MGSIANYILNEKDLISKIEIIYFLSKRLEINFDKSIIFKTEIARMFLKYTKAKLDNNLVLTASLLCNCKKVDDAQKIGKLKTYAQEGAEYLKTLGFDERFCKICEGVNRYSGINPREPESDVLELADQFGGMLIDRPERVGFAPDEALVLLEHRNLKSEYNRYLEIFRGFVEQMEKVQIQGRQSARQKVSRQFFGGKRKRLLFHGQTASGFYPPLLRGQNESNAERLPDYSLEQVKFQQIKAEENNGNSSGKTKQVL